MTARAEIGSALFWVGVALSLAGTALVSSLALARGDAPLSYFQSLPASHLAHLRGSLTWRGFLGSRWYEQTVLFGGPSVGPNVDAYRSIYDPPGGQRVGPLQPGPRKTPRFACSVHELDDLLDSLSRVPAMLDSSPHERGFLECVLLDSTGSNATVRILERKMSQGDAQVLLDRVRGALRGNAQGSKILHNFACFLSIPSAITPTECTARVAIDQGAVQRDGDARGFVGTVRVTNRSDRAIGAPIYLVLELMTPNVAVLDATGNTCQPLRVGSPPVKIGTPYMLLPIGRSLARHASIEVRARFKSSEGESPSFACRVFAGPGDI